MHWYMNKMEDFMKQNPMILRYGAPAPVIDDFLPYSTYECAWERYSLPLGNGFFGALFQRIGDQNGAVLLGLGDVLIFSHG